VLFQNVINDLKFNLSFMFTMIVFTTNLCLHSRQEFSKTFSCQANFKLLPVV